MINLIPPQAKKSITIEYWLRVISTWQLIFSGALLLSIFVMVPAYVLLNVQVSAFSDSAAVASEKIATFKDVSKELDSATVQARALIEGLRYSQISEYEQLFRRLENNEITLSQIGIERTKDSLSPIRVSGKSSNRQALAAFRDRLLAEPTVESVDLPISNLAKDRDIQFSMTVIIKKI